MITIHSHKELIVWQKAVDFVERIYRLSRLFPRDEMYGLTSQIRRAVVSIPSNIAEGQGRKTTREFLAFLSIPNGSLKEVETQVIIARRLAYADERQTTPILTAAAEVRRMIKGLIRSLEKK